MKKSTTVKISKDTLKLLENLRDRMNARSMDEVIQKLIMEWRMKILDDIFGIDRGRITSFTEGDRGESRS